MKKKLIQTFACFCFAAAFLMMFLPVQVAAATSIVYDSANLFTDSEKKDLEKEAQQISDKYGINVVIYTTNAKGKSGNYARDFVESEVRSALPEGYLVLSIDLADKSYFVDFYGHGEVASFSQDMKDSLGDAARPALSSRDYYEAASDFLEESATQLELAKGGMFRKLTLYPGKTLMIIGGTCVGALVAAAALTASKASQHKDKQERQTAEEYGQNFDLTVNTDRFVSHYQTRTPRPKASSSGGSHGSSGHSGSGGHF